MQSLQSQLADMEKQLSSKIAELESSMALIRRFQQATDGQADNLLARFRAGQNIEEPSDTLGGSEEPSSAPFAKAISNRYLPPSPESLKDVLDVQSAPQEGRRSRLAPSVAFAAPSGDRFPERPSSALSTPGKRQVSFSGALSVAREPSITQLCPFGSHLSIMQWDSNLTAQFDNCLRAGISALSPAYRAKCNYLLSTPGVDITSDGLLYQVSGLLAITSSDHRNRHFHTWPMLNWTRYSVLGALSAALSKANGGSDILAFIVAILTGWERMFGDLAAFQIHLSALQEMITEHGAQSSSKPSLDTGLVKSPSLPAAARLPVGFGNLRVLGLLPNSLLDLISRLDFRDFHQQVDMNEWRRVSILLVALRPTSKPAVDAFVNGELGLQVTECVRISAMMFITLVLAVTDNDHWNQPMLSAIEPTYSDTHGIPVETLVGSVYDEVLLWSLCVFYALAGRLVARQLRCFRRLLRAFTIPPEAKSWPSLQRLMKRYLHHPYFDKRLKEIMEVEEQRARDEMVYEIG
ncbi:hypothetical protein D0861_01674 [Hortaea werneckii]|uniref:Transcription factor domain-containing protein n=1 Tax=Hortaea werneckii TaxID=91943 RepID=A0A3M7FYI1_HORWE|nr:hypothetical protein D0861_01674 [Hortaea werneckii]